MPSEFDYDSWQARIAALELTSEVGGGIMKLVSEQSRTAGQLSRVLQIPIPTVLYYLSRLETIGLVDYFKGTGKRLREVKYYRASSSTITFRIGGENE